MFIGNFSALATTSARRIALEFAGEAVGAAMPARLLRRRLRVRDTALLLGRKRFSLEERRVWVLGAGKAAAPMAAAVEDVMGQRVDSGLVVTVPGSGGPRPQRVRVVYGDHPVPGRASLRATSALFALAAKVGPDDLVLWLISGGASALLAAPVQGMTLQAKQAVTKALLLSGATIDEMNAVRKHLSQTKGGQIARLLAPAQVVTIALSDVVSASIDIIGSGPTLPDPTTYADALDVLDRYRLRSRVPVSARAHLESGALGQRPETPKPEDPCFADAFATVIGGPATVAGAAARAARRSGLQEVQVVTDRMAGEARTVAGSLGSALRRRARGRRDGPCVLVAAGEVTVTVKGEGRGGRCQELAAALIPEIAGLPGCAVVCVATDGQDYLPGVGGALVDGETAARAEAQGLRVQDYLDSHDTNRLHRRLGTLLEMAPTGTNVCDLLLCVLGAS